MKPLRAWAATLASAAALAAGGAQATPMLDLSRHQLGASYAIPALAGLGLEASAVTYARDRGTLFVVGDEGLGVVELSLQGQVLSTMAFSWAGTGSSNQDAEGLAYLGNGLPVVVDERPQRAYPFSYSAGASVALAAQPWAAISTWSPSNIGIEGLSWDPRDGSFVSVKQDHDGNPARGPQEVRAGTLSFAAGGGSVGLPILFDAYRLGLDSLSDVMVLAGVDALAGTPAADHLLVLSLESRRLVETTRGRRPGRG